MVLKTKENIRTILEKLEEVYAGTKTALNFNNSFQLLIATVLSAQSTDEQVNKVTAKLFDIFPRPEDIAVLTPDELAEYIKAIGLYRNKSKNIIGLCKILTNKYDGQVPCSFKELLELPGVGRKTANVVLSNAFDIPAIAVDTHVFRVSNRLGLAKGKDTFNTELELKKIIPIEKWSDAHHWLIWHGRKICKARNPECGKCFLASYCPSRIF